jgi:hypothetical protein
METLFDKPEPGAGYLIFNIAFILVLIAIPVFITFMARLKER